MEILKILSKKTIVKVRGGGGQQSMVKDHTFALFNFGTVPLMILNELEWMYLDSIYENFDLSGHFNLLAVPNLLDLTLGLKEFG